MKALDLVVSKKKIFLCFAHCKSMGDNYPQGRNIFDPRGMVGRIYKEDHYTLLHTKYGSSGPCDFEEDFLCFSMTPPGAGPKLTPGAWLAGFIKRTTVNCYTQNRTPGARLAGFIQRTTVHCYTQNRKLYMFEIT